MNTNISKEIKFSVVHHKWISIPLPNICLRLERDFYRRRLFCQKEHQEWLRWRPFSLSIVFPLGINVRYKPSQYIQTFLWRKPLLCNFLRASFSWSPRLFLPNRICCSAIRNVQCETVSWGCHWCCHWFWNNIGPNIFICGL